MKKKSNLCIFTILLPPPPFFLKKKPRMMIPSLSHSLNNEINYNLILSAMPAPPIHSI